MAELIIHFHFVLFHQHGRIEKEKTFLIKNVC